MSTSLEDLDEEIEGIIRGDIDVLDKLESLAEQRYRKLHSVHWREVPSAWQIAYGRVQYRIFLHKLALFKECRQQKVPHAQMAVEAVQALDRALLVMGPDPELIAKLAWAQNTLAHPISTYNSQWPTMAPLDIPLPPAASLSSLVSPSLPAQLSSLNDLVQHYDRPFVMRSKADDWPAIKKWKDPNYFTRQYGHRLVPIEVGKHYLDDSWNQQIIPFGEFIASNFGPQPQESPSPTPICYLAQHNLFAQIPQLLEDFYVPDYCYVDLPEARDEPLVNIWFGVAHTITPLHFDPYYNIFAQVVGWKCVSLLSPHLSPQVQAEEGSNTGRLDLCQIPPDQWPLPLQQVILGPGDLLYIPRRWWHHVQALTRSISISFWL